MMDAMAVHETGRAISARRTITVRIDRTRMAMDGNCYAYDGIVALSELGLRVKDGCTTICKGTGRFVSFVDATRPAELDAMPLGWERYQAALAHEKAANAQLLELAKAKYPELKPATVWPTLWVEIPELDASHATRYAEVSNA